MSMGLEVKDKFSGIFKEDNSDFSMMRFVTFILVMAVIAVVAVIVILAFNTGAVISNGVMLPADTSIIRELAWLVGILLGFAIGGKATQKWAERENTTETKTETKPVIPGGMPQ
jgi:uncharacterized Fe-S cluster-containing radical SAM superfamily protein